MAASQFGPVVTTNTDGLAVPCDHVIQHASKSPPGKFYVYFLGLALSRKRINPAQHPNDAAAGVTSWEK